MSVAMASYTNKVVTIYVRLLDEGTEVSRPTQAIDLGGDRFRLIATPDYDPENETWEFLPDTEVRGEIRSSEVGEHLFAIR